jgi:hypothetical protein
LFRADRRKVRQAGRQAGRQAEKEDEANILEKATYIMEFGMGIRTYCEKDGSVHYKKN